LGNIKRLLDENITSKISFDVRNIRKKVEDWMDIKDEANNEIPKNAFKTHISQIKTITFYLFKP